MARFLIEHGYLGSSLPYGPSKHALLLASLAVEWNDLAMWEEVLKKTTAEGFTTQPGMDLLVQAWSTFTFDRTKHTLVYPVLAPMPHSVAHFSLRPMCLAGLRRLFVASLTPCLR